MDHKEKFANIGTSPQDIPLNQMLGRQAFQDVPSGIVQVVQYNRTNQVESSYASDTTLMKVTITPKYSGSFFWVIGACGGCGTRDTSTLYEMNLARITDGVTTTLMYPATYIGSTDASGGEDYPMFNWVDKPDPDAGVDISYTLTGYRISGGSNCYFHHSNGSLDSTMTVLEITGVPFELQNNQTL